MSLYNEKIGTFTPDKLIAGNDVGIVTQSATIRSGQGKLNRGTVLAKSSGTAGDGKLLILGTTAASNETLTPHSILCDEVDATSADAVGEVYVTGQFAKEALAVKADYTITEADIAALRDGGIFLENIID